MGRFRKKPVVIDAIQWDGNNGTEMGNFITNFRLDNLGENNSLQIHTLEGTMTASVGDWIIKGVSGEFYPCKPDIFLKTYDSYDPS